jgi:histidinol dehydrogenase
VAIWLEQTSDDFEERFSAFLSTKREVSEDVNAIVRAIINDVRARGDAALIDYSSRFDKVDLSKVGLRVTEAEIDTAVAATASDVLDALRLAAERIEKHHARQMPKDDIYEDAIGVGLGSRWTAIEAVGLYVPGGTASYPSSVLMNAMPARVAGVPRLVMVVPAGGGRINPAVLAYGTPTIAPVAKIVGPGNAYVAAAKRQVFGTVGIDMIAGPSEVLVIADSDNDPDWIAADLLAQAEHDAGAQSILMTDDADFGRAVEAAVERQLKTLSRAETAAASWRDFGAVILVGNFQAALPLANRIAAEHLELAVADPDALLPGIVNAGAIFIGRHTPEVIGDYVGGSNHVLPTARSARFSSGLGVLDFVKRSSILRLGPEQLRKLAPAAITLAKSEGLDAHARSVAIRLNANPENDGG